MLLVDPAPLGAQESRDLATVTAIESSVVEAIAKAEKSVVAIARVRRPNEPSGLSEADATAFRTPLTDLDLDPFRPDYVPHDFGTGVVVDSRGLVLTNYHVLGETAGVEYVVWTDRKPYKAVVKAADPWLDLAILQIQAENLTPITFGKANVLKKGQFVIALGNPYAIARDGQPSASWGIISNLARYAPQERTAVRAREGRDMLHQYGTLIQTDAKLELGCSGGALVNLKGEMVGLTTAWAALVKYERSGGFAIPVDDDFRSAVETLKRGRMPDYGFLGVSPALLSVEERQRGLRGARVANVVPATPAAQAGLLAGDIIVQVDGLEVIDDIHLIRLLSGMPADSQVNFSVLRNEASGRGASVSMDIRLSKKRVDGRRAIVEEFAPPRWRGMRVDYATASPSFWEQSRDLDPMGCVGVIEVERNSLAWKAGMRPGDFVAQVGKARVTTPQEFLEVVGSLSGPVTLRLATPPTDSRIVAAETAVVP